MHCKPASHASAAVILLAAASSPALAARYSLDYTATVTSATGRAVPAVGTRITGSFTLDTDPGAYVPELPSNWTPSTAMYTLPVPAYLATLDAHPWSVASGLVSVQVFDNDLSPLGPGEPGDAVSVGGAAQGLSFGITLFGPADAFSGITPPDARVLAGFWSRGSFFGYTAGFADQVVATIDGVSVSAVPEPPAALLGLPGLLAWGIFMRQRRARR